MATKRQIFFNSKTPRYLFLTTFYECGIKIDGKRYRTMEHYYQSQKTRNPTLKRWIESAPTPRYAFESGRALRDPDKIKGWEKRRMNVMRKALLAKFTQNKSLGDKLLSTGDAELHEDNERDILWCAYGKDMLGKLLMEVRSRIRKTKVKNQ